MEERGHRVLAPDLPAHGDDCSGRYLMSLRAYARRISEVTATSGKPVVAVGHSMGGMVLKQALADSPPLFRAAVYLCAFVPLHGESLTSLSLRDRESLVPSSTRFGIRGMSVRPKMATSLFYADCSNEVATWATSRLQIEPYWPLFCRYKETAKVEVPATYIGCSEDRVISIDRQRIMAARSGIEMLATMKAGHSPFLSAPTELAEILTNHAAAIAGQDR